MIYGNHNKQVEIQQQNRNRLLKALADIGIAQAFVHYSGGGDSGDVTDVTALPAELAPKLPDTKVSFLQVTPTYYLKQDGNLPEIQERPLTLKAALEEFAMIWVELHHGGWENNDGGSGSVTFNVAENTCSLEHLEYYTESTRYEYEL
ncbi:MAG: DUF6878 family protein [Pseudomonadota bacterium]